MSIIAEEVGGGVRPALKWELVLALLAVPEGARRVRRDVWLWLAGLAWPELEVDDIVMAVNEAFANVVDHAYPPETRGPLTLHGWPVVDSQAWMHRACVAVTDGGRWGAHQPDTFPLWARGHGLAVINACMDRVNIMSSVGGTTVVMTSAPVPLWP